MRFCILLGSPNTNGNTSVMCRSFMEELERKGAEYSYIALADKYIAPCSGCFNCQQAQDDSAYENYGCHQRDDMYEIIDQISKADCLVLATPIYTWYCTSEMKNVLDRLYAMNLAYGDQSKKVAILASHGYDADYATSPFETGIKRFCEQCEFEYAGMYSKRDTDGYASFNSDECINGVKRFVRDIMGTGEEGDDRRFEEDGFILDDASRYKKAFRNLYTLYIHELSQYTKWLGSQITMDGDFLPEEFSQYFDSDEKSPYIIVVDERPVGFVVFSYPDTDEDPEECDCYIEEIFITYHYRKNGIAGKIAQMFWRDTGGECGVCAVKDNKTAVAFWDRQIEKSGYEYTREDAGDIWFYKINIDK